jgi:GMP synthase (glutamine-hydrolysing)
MTDTAHQEIWILDFGSQYTQLIARRVRELGVFSRVVPGTVAAGELDWPRISGLIFSGGPASAVDVGAPQCAPGILFADVPKLGICYGLQLYGLGRGGRIKKSERREYGRARIELVEQTADALLSGLPRESDVWMSHGDSLAEWPASFQVLARTSDIPAAAIAEPEKQFYGVQFHPEVEHTAFGREILSNFLFDICRCRGDWSIGDFIKEAIAAIRQTVGEAEVVLAVSGGVDSSVCAGLLARALGERVHPVFVDNGLLRLQEAAEVTNALAGMGVKVQAVDAAAEFLSALQGVTDPEQKRKSIGKIFIDVFEREARRHARVRFLAQGTLYPDLIESVSVRGPSATIKSHHNVGGLPARMNLKLVEPLKWLFKDEVRKVGRELGLPGSLIGRHPFPGPGLAVRILGEITREKLDLLRAADKVFIDELRASDWYDKIWQAFAVLIPGRTVGVMGDERTYERAICLRAVTSSDGMTADVGEIPYHILKRAANKIINSVQGINRVVYDISSKPPATIEWE